MAFYLNPSDETKEDFLIREGTFAPTVTKMSDVPSGQVFVTLVQNPEFSAAMIPVSQKDHEALQRPDDHRPMRRYLVPLEKILSVMPSLEKDALQSIYPPASYVKIPEEPEARKGEVSLLSWITCLFS